VVGESPPPKEVTWESLIWKALTVTQEDARIYSVFAGVYRSLEYQYTPRGVRERPPYSPCLRHPGRRVLPPRDPYPKEQTTSTSSRSRPGFLMRCAGPCLLTRKSTAADATKKEVEHQSGCP